MAINCEKGRFLVKSEFEITPVFKFKQFQIEQDRCAMKVGTDGVLLGAWAEGGRRVLDIGTGSGLIALMMAQRFAGSQVLGIDLDADACSQACENITASPFAGRVGVECSSLQQFALKAAADLGSGRSSGGEPRGNGFEPFDCIVSNPPFFENSLLNPDPQKAAARHAQSLPFGDLIAGVERLLSKDGVFSVVLPADLVERFSSMASFSGFYLSRLYSVKTTPRKPAKRVLLAFRKRRPATFDKREVCLQNEDGSRSDWYAELTREFYLFP